MKTSRSVLARRTWPAAALAALAFAGASSGAFAQAPSEAQIAEALSPKPLTRSLTTVAPATLNAAREDAAFVDSLRTAKTRSLSMGQREQLAKVTATRPSIDLEIPFDYNSATIGPKAMPFMQSLGAALARPEFKSGTYAISGYTDAKGADRYNQALSERRAASVKRFLVKNYGIPETSLISTGYGKDKLKNKTDPFAPENRRVEATNLSDLKSASR